MERTLPIQNDKLISRILISYAFTFMVINLADSLTMIVDGTVVSNGLSPLSLAAISLADPSYKIATLFTSVVSTGLQSLCAQAMGAGDKKKTNSIFASGMVATIGVAVLLTIVCLTCTDTLCVIFGAERGTELYTQLYAYLKSWFTGIPGYVLFFVLLPLVTLDGNKKLATVATFIQSLINIGGDILAVFVFKTGIEGVGFSTGLSYNVSALLLLLNFFSKYSVFKPFSEKPDFSSLFKVISIGTPSVTKYICGIFSSLLINRTIMSVGGSIAMSAISVKGNILGFCVIVGNGVAKSVGLLAQILYNEKDATSLKLAVKTGFKVHLVLDIILSSLIFIFAGGIASLYFPNSTEEYKMAILAIRCLAVSLPINGCNMIFIDYLTSAREKFACHTMTSFQRLFSILFFTFVLGKTIGPTGLFLAIPIAEVAVLAGYIIFTILFKNKGDIMSSLLMIPNGFGYNEENSFSVSISTIEEAVEVSESIEKFCDLHNVDKRKSYYSARCMEELAVNIIQNGFKSDDKKHHCDIRVMLEPDEVVLRLRDDCPYYNLRERYEVLAEDDIDTGVWIKMVFALAKDVNYINIFKTNTLIIRV